MGPKVRDFYWPSNFLVRILAVGTGHRTLFANSRFYSIKILLEVIARGNAWWEEELLGNCYHLWVVAMRSHLISRV